MKIRTLKDVYIPEHYFQFMYLNLNEFLEDFPLEKDENYFYHDGLLFLFSEKCLYSVQILEKELKELIKR